MSEPDSHWDRVAALFEAAQELPPEKQRAYLDEHCDDAAVRSEVESLLGELVDDDEFLEQPTHLQEIEATAVTSFGEVSVDQIGSYRILEKLGEGGMGVVYRVEQENPKRIAALKVIRPGYATAELLRRFEHEAQVLGRLQHDGIARIYEAGTADLGFGPQPYFAMEYIDGPSLTEYVQAQGCSTEDRLELLARICDAVQHAHEKGVIHRDLKPGNILVGDGGQPKVLDFGVARVTDSDVQVTTLQTTPGQVIGTLQYMSPEQASGDPDQLDVRSDVYSLGVIAYELLSGRLPHDLSGRMIHEAVRVVVEEDPQPLSQVANVYRGDVDTVVGKAMAREKERRYRTAQEFASDLRRYLKHEPIHARPPSSLYYLRKFAQRHKGLTASVLIVFGLVVAFAVQKAIDNERLSAKNALLEQRFRQVRSLAQLFVRFDGEIRNIVGTTAARRKLVEQARDKLGNLALEKEDDRELQLEVAEAYELVGDVLADPTIPNLGETAEALDCYQESLAIQLRLAAAGSTAADGALAAERLARAHRKVGMTRALLGDYAEAARHYGVAGGILNEACAATPDSSALLRELVRLHRREGAMEVRRGQFPAAIQSYGDALQVLQERLAGPAADPVAQLELALEQHEISIERNSAERRAGAKKLGVVIKSLIEIRDQVRTLVDANPRHPRPRRVLVRCLDRIGLNYWRARRHGQAEGVFLEANRIREVLQNEDRNNITARRDVAVGHERLGRLGYSQKKLLMALREHEAALALREQLHLDDPANKDIQRNVATSAEHVGTVLLDILRLEWLQELRSAPSIGEAPGMSAATAAAAQLAFIGWAEELSARALAAFESSAKQRRSLLADAPGDVLLREGLAVLHQRLGQLQQFVMRDAFAAQGHYEKYLELASGLASERPDDQRAQLMRLAALDKVAKCHVALQNYEAATPLFVEILELRTRHQSENPGARNAQALATTHVGAAGLHRAIGFDEQRPVAARRAALAKALVHYRVALPIFVELQEAGGGGRTLDNATRVREWIAACEKLLGGLASTETPSD